jgi:hypothetical protein
MFRSREQNMSSHNQNFEVQDSQTKKKCRSMMESPLVVFGRGLRKIETPQQIKLQKKSSYHSLLLITKTKKLLTGWTIKQDQ